MSGNWPITDNTDLRPAALILAYKRRIFHKWKAKCFGSGIKNLDEYGNEYYLLNGIYCIHIQREARYKFGLHHSERRDSERITFDNGYYVLTTRTPNFTFIEDSDILHFILHFDIESKQSLHKELRKRMKVTFSEDDSQAVQEGLS